ncbi:MAG: portal protein, partial [Gammaproteobacteria bacterium]
LGQEITHSRGYDGTELQENHKRALRSYFGKPRGDEVEGRATIISMDVADTVDSVMAELSPMLKSTLIEFESTGEEDEDQAQLESDMVLHIAEKSNVYEQFASAAHNALLLQNGWLKIFIDEQTHTWETEHEAVDVLELTELLTPAVSAEQLEVVKQADNADDPSKSDITIKHSLTRRKLCCQSIAPEMMLFSAGHESQDLRDIRFVAEKRLMQRSELIEMGVSRAVVDELAAVNYETYYTNVERQFSADDSRGGHEPSTEVVDCYDVYMMVDMDGDGIAERWRFLVGNYEANTMLLKEQAKYVPYCTGSALVMPNRVIGISLYEKMKQVEDGKTHVLRQWLDNQNVANNTRFGYVEGEVNAQQALNSRPGQLIGMRSPDALFPIPFNDAGPSCLAALQYLDQVRTERGGAAVDMQTGVMQVSANAGADAAGREWSHKEQMTTYYCRNLVEGLFKRSYMLIHEALRCYYDAEMQAKLHGKWAKSKPSRWVPRETCKILGGLSSSERHEKKQDLSMQLQMQSQGMQAGLDGVLVDASKIHATLTDWTRLADLDAVETYWLDPDSPEAQQAYQDKARSQEEAAAKEEDLKQRMFDQEQNLDKYKHDTQLAFDRWKEEFNAQVEEMKITGGGLADLELESLKQAAPKEEADNAA